MKTPEDMEFHFDCPKCDRPMSGSRELLGQQVNCPDCGESFCPYPRDEKATATDSAATPKCSPGRAERIRKQGDLFLALAQFSTYLAVTVLLISVCISLGAGNLGFGGYIAAASLLGVASLFFLTAQIVHIRANTEK